MDRLIVARRLTSASFNPPFRETCVHARDSSSNRVKRKFPRETFRRIRLSLSDPFDHARAIAGLFRKQELKTRAVSRLRIADNNTVRVRFFSLPWKRKGKAGLLLFQSKKTKAHFISWNFAHILRALKKFIIRTHIKNKTVRRDVSEHSIKVNVRMVRQLLKK